MVSYYGWIAHATRLNVMNNFISLIGRHAGKVNRPPTLDEMNEIAAQGWAGKE